MKEKVIPNKCIKAKAMNASIVPAVAQVFSFATFITINTTIRPIKYPTTANPKKLQRLCFTPYTELKNCSFFPPPNLCFHFVISHFTEKHRDTDCITAMLAIAPIISNIHTTFVFIPDPYHDLIYESNSLSQI